LCERKVRMPVDSLSSFQRCRLATWS